MVSKNTSWRKTIKRKKLKNISYLDTCKKCHNGWCIINALDMWEVLQSNTTSNLEIHQRKQMFKHTSIKDYCTYNTHI